MDEIPKLDTGIGDCKINFLIFSNLNSLTPVGAIIGDMLIPIKDCPSGILIVKPSLFTFFGN
jgi:hypothetical protein